MSGTVVFLYSSEPFLTPVVPSMPERTRHRLVALFA